MRSGFTLVELAIVLVIIGLLVGGVLAGRELIFVAQLNKTIRQKEEFETASYTFRNKYNCIPGDCATATNFGFAANGDGNGELVANGSGPGGTNRDEAQYFWSHLVGAGLLAGNWGGAGWSSAKAGQHTAPLPIASASGWGIWCQNSAYDPFPGLKEDNALVMLRDAILIKESARGAIRPLHGYLIDLKMDDGLPASGRVYAFGRDGSVADGPCEPDDYTLWRGADGANSQYCMDSASPENYNEQTSRNACIMLIQNSITGQ